MEFQRSHGSRAPFSPRLLPESRASRLQGACHHRGCTVTKDMLPTPTPMTSLNPLVALLEHLAEATWDRMYWAEILDCPNSETTLTDNNLIELMKAKTPRRAHLQIPRRRRAEEGLRLGMVHPPAQRQGRAVLRPSKETRLQKEPVHDVLTPRPQPLPTRHPRRLRPTTTHNPPRVLLQRRTTSCRAAALALSTTVRAKATGLFTGTPRRRPQPASTPPHEVIRNCPHRPARPALAIHPLSKHPLVDRTTSVRPRRPRAKNPTTPPAFLEQPASEGPIQLPDDLYSSELGGKPRWIIVLEREG